MNKTKTFYLWMILNAIFFAAPAANATVVEYTLDNIFLEDDTQLIGTFSWTFNAGDFENGVGQFTNLTIPHTAHNHTDTIATIDIGQSIEITLAGVSTHDDGVDITLVLAQPLTPTTSSLIVLGAGESKYEIGGNGFHDGLFQSGSISPVPEPSSIFLFLSGLAFFDVVTRRRRLRGSPAPNHSF